MEKKSNPFLDSDTAKIASSPAARQLYALLQQNGSEFTAAREQATAGNYEMALRTLSEALNAPEAQRLLQQLRNADG